MSANRINPNPEVPPPSRTYLDVPIYMTKYIAAYLRFTNASLLAVGTETLQEHMRTSQTDNT